MSNLIIRKIKENEWDDAMGVVWRTFLRFDAADYEQEGINRFLEFISDERLRKMWSIGEYVIYAAFVQSDDGKEPQMVGVASYRSKNHLSLLFVLSQYHKQGIGKKLVDTVCMEIKSFGLKDYLTVHASSYALGFYHKLGFIELDEMQREHGICYTPMQKML